MFLPASVRLFVRILDYAESFEPDFMKRSRITDDSRSGKNSLWLILEAKVLRNGDFKTRVENTMRNVEAAYDHSSQ